MNQNMDILQVWKSQKIFLVFIVESFKALWKYVNITKKMSCGQLNTFLREYLPSPLFWQSILFQATNLAKLASLLNL